MGIKTVTVTTTTITCDRCGTDIDAEQNSERGPRSSFFYQSIDIKWHLKSHGVDSAYLTAYGDNKKNESLLCTQCSDDFLKFMESKGKS